eukprot:7874865-Alexandrium_andersonii.AAC.1
MGESAPTARLGAPLRNCRGWRGLNASPPRSRLQASRPCLSAAAVLLLLLSDSARQLRKGTR